MKLKGAEIVWGMFGLCEGVEVVFGYPGRREHADLRRVMLNYPHHAAAHEQGAAHMAWRARVSGRLGVAMATSVRGATNLVTGICTAMMDLVPTVFITGQVAAHLIGAMPF
ncbi:MAG: thiamine pyrophosphate-binding protein [Anaerolineales bacterium]